MSDCGLVRTPADLERFEALRIAEFVARAYPEASYQDLRVVLDWTLWGFAADDQHDDLVGSPQLLRTRYLTYAAVIEDGLGDQVTSMHMALADIRRRILARSHPGCLRRFSAATKDWFDAMHWETSNRVRATPPSPGYYLRMRELTVGMYTEFALFDVSHRVRTEESFWVDPDVRRLMAMGCNVIGWANDVFSYPKEQAIGDPHNLVLLLWAERGGSIEDAVTAAIEMHDLEMLRFLQLEEAMLRRSTLAAQPETLRAFLGLTRSWIRGNIDWAYASDRYGLSPRVVGADIPAEVTRSPSALLRLVGGRV